jgi:hypothetical protein
MTTPSVTELPRRLEPTSIDTFLGGDPRPLARVVPLHSRERDPARRSPRPRPRRPLRPAPAATRRSPRRRACCTAAGEARLAHTESEEQP